MVEQRGKDSGRNGRPANRGGKARRAAAKPAERRARPAKRSARPAKRAVARPVKRNGGRPSRKARTRRSASHGPRKVIPSNRWRPMRRVDVPGHGIEQPASSEQPTQAAQQVEQTPPRHGILGRLFSR